MRISFVGRLIVLTGICLCWLILMPVVVVDAEAGALDQASVQAYLEKKTVGDPGSCLVDDIKMEVIGIADISPGHQADVFYRYEYILRCNRSKKNKNGQGVLNAVRLRNGKWLDRETFSTIPQ